MQNSRSPSRISGEHAVTKQGRGIKLSFMLTADFVYLNLWKWTMTISAGCTVRCSVTSKLQFKGIHDCWLVNTVCQFAYTLWAEKLIKDLCLIRAWRSADVASTPTKLDTWVTWRWACFVSVADSPVPQSSLMIYSMNMIRFVSNGNRARFWRFKLLGVNWSPVLQNDEPLISVFLQTHLNDTTFKDTLHVISLIFSFLCVI